MTDDPRMTDQALELLPCPLCKAEGHTLFRGFRYKDGSSEKYEAIMCPTCDCDAPLKSWNTRPTPAERPAPPAYWIKYVPDIVKNAMLTMWNYICDDTKCHPLDIEHGKGKFLTFEPKHWAQFAGDMAAKNIADLIAIERPVPQVRELLREARQYVSDAGNDEDAETQRNSQALLDEIDAALTAGRHVSQGVRTTAEIEQILFSHFYTGEPGEHEAIKAAAVALASERPVPQVREELLPYEKRALQIMKLVTEQAEEMSALTARPSDAAVAKPLPGELALIQIAMETLRHIANYTPVSRIQPVMIARDALKKIDALTFESEPVKALALPPDEPARVAIPHEEAVREDFHADFIRRCQAYLDDAPADGRHSDAAGSNAYELIQEVIWQFSPTVASERVSEGETMTSEDRK